MSPLAEVSCTWRFISTGRVGKGMENQIRGPHAPQLPPILSPSVQTLSTEPEHHGLSLSVYFAINKEKEPLFDVLVQGLQASSSLDPFTSLRRRSAAAQLGKIYTYFYIMENSLPDIKLLTLICFLWKKQGRRCPKLGH